jgi:signal transduction histidine kinase
VAEVLTNAEKHSEAREAQICMSHSGSMLRIEVTDFGLGGADPAAGSGLAAVERRLATFDGILAISSPAGGPTIVVIEVPCMPSSQSAWVSVDLPGERRDRADGSWGSTSKTAVT